MELKYRPVGLIILDGWGHNPDPTYNAIHAARTPFLDRMMAENPHALVETSGEAVGLPEGQMGTSEVGHLNMGAGRIVYQSLVRISKALKNGEIKHIPVFTELIQYLVANKKPLHFMGLVSPGGVHSHTEHLYGFIRLAVEMGVQDIYVHAFLDGRDTPPASAKEYLAELEAELKKIGTGRIATVAGRYYAMDRDKRWERVEKAYAAMVDGEGEKAPDALSAVDASYQKGVHDEFVVPTVIEEDGRPVATIEPGDGVIFFNFRPDRAREITRAFVDRNFTGFPRKKGFLATRFVCLTQYDEELDVPLLFPPEPPMENILGKYLSALGFKQLRIAETEKYAHVTYFFNGGEEVPFQGEERILIPSPKVATYDLQPEMSALEVTDRVLAEIASDRFDVIIMNYANGDMVGHTGVWEAAVKAAETVDACLARVVPAILEKGGVVLITADHGNAELMVDPVTKEPWTAHTTFPTPVILIGYKEKCRLKNGILADIAPTLLELMGLPKPAEMTGHSLIEHLP
ncbi:MAG TPA: 2,3-bisphosphoglycerate-independent phosphoglycerate mutase [Firmicutes bacterium]|uniref:2,3-bisphosphoglycerate-independent phosphoglycerate mutase n=1 Tax=Capillibacterium thermochitinicola TaxID=2699427 RepID=A0A8J6HZ92_9FIRM|nr:2,3-bisphosphoglycerate-independent phosphoglycerate mutase [Capillibacterium thermochitinicola]MBA2132615.1 2,3-bisphosphoglycerate-independent phosphoglycerate mutase [Capillibacterium thermochitinicola]HHW12790.1 2,3-bisphosphoglycerate-independent phosphoglycerate mutase [Bacillota bacterium]